MTARKTTRISKNPATLYHKIFHGQAGNFTNVKRIEAAVNDTVARANEWINKHSERIEVHNIGHTATPYTAHVVVWYRLKDGIDVLDDDQPYGDDG